MFKKYFSFIVALAIILGGILLSSLLSSQRTHLNRQPVSTAATSVKTILIDNQEFNKDIKTSGRVTAFNKIEIYAEVTGVLDNSRLDFREGTRFSKGQPLLKINDDVYRNNLLAKKSSLLNKLTSLLPDLKLDYPKTAEKWQLYLAKFQLDRELDPLPQPQSDQEKYYIASRDIYSLYYEVKSMEATHAKYAIEAPYDGVVTSALIKPGTLVRAGQKLGEFTNNTIFEIAAPVSVNDLDAIEVGQHVTLTSLNIRGDLDGKITRINSAIDQQSQSLQIFIQTTDKRLKDGMYLVATISSTVNKRATMIPRSALVGTDQVYVIVDSALYLKKVDIIEEGNEQVAIQGLENGVRILGEPLVSAYDGMKLENVTLN